MVTRWSQRVARRRRQPRPLGAQHQREPVRRAEAGERRRAGLDDGGDEREARRRAAPPGRRASGWRARWAAKTRRPARRAPPCGRTGPRSAGTASARRRRTRRRGGRSPPGCRRRSGPRARQPRARRAAADAGGGRSPMARQPRWTWKPAIASIVACDAERRHGNAPPSASASVASRGAVTSTDNTRRPLPSRRRTTRSLSATKRPPSALRWRSLSWR